LPYINSEQNYLPFATYLTQFFIYCIAFAADGANPLKVKSPQYGIYYSPAVFSIAYFRIFVKANLAAPYDESD